MGHHYPPLKIYHQQMLDVGNGHQIYLEQSGNPDGLPVLYLHGGPGAGLSDDYRRYFDPRQYRIIGFDQRGCGRSTPFGRLEHNTTRDLLDDIQRIRQTLNIDKWMLCGGSWGTTLALLSAIEHPKAVNALVLRGIFLARQEDMDWFIQQTGGAAQVFPEHYHALSEVVKSRPEEQSLIDAYYEIFKYGDELTQAHAAKAWCMWEERISVLNSSVIEQDLAHDLHHAASLALLECHYIKHRCFIDENEILNNVQRISAIPGTIIHGRYDMVCKLESAYTLSRVWRNSQLNIVPEAGHSGSDPHISDAICQATAAMAKFLKEGKV